MKSALFALTLIGCLGPDTTEQCIAVDASINTICELEADPDRQAEVKQNCARFNGFAQSKGCANERKAHLVCQNDALVGVACEDVFDQLDLTCAYEEGRYTGCLDAN